MKGYQFKSWIVYVIVVVMAEPLQAQPLKNISIYLTFDDGPLSGSEAVNSISLTDSIKMNVFIIGRFVMRNDTGMKRFIAYRNNPYIEMGNHSYSHAWSHHYHLYYEHPGQVVEDFKLNWDTLKLDNKIGRLPGRNCWRIDGKCRDDLADATKAADSLATLGYRLFGWDIEWQCDSSGKVKETAPELLKRIENMVLEKRSFIPENIVILCHDPMFKDDYNVLQLKEFLVALKAKENYRLEHLGNYAKPVL